MSIGIRIKEIRRELGLNVEELSKKIDIPARTIGGYERNEAPPNLKFLNALNKNLHINVNYILSGNGNIFSKPENASELVEIEQIGIAPQCGCGTEVYCEPFIEPLKISRSSIAYYLKCSSPGNLKIFKATGDSMSKTIEDGDWLLVDIGRKDPSISGVYIFKVMDLWRCKRLNMTIDGKLELISDNKEYEKEIMKPEDNIQLEIVGRVMNNLSKSI